MAYADDVYAEMSNAGSKSYMMLRQTVLDLIRMVQFFIRLAREKHVKTGEIEDFKKLIRQTNGKTEVYSIPFTEKMSRENLQDAYLFRSDTQFDSIQEQLKSSGIKFAVISDPENSGKKAIAVRPENLEKAKDCLQRVFLTKYSVTENPVQANVEGYHYIKPVELDKIKKELNSMGIRYAVLPDTNGTDFTFQIGIARDDKGKFDVFFENYIKKNALSGGTLPAKDLDNLLSQRTTILSVPEQTIQDCFGFMKQMNITYADLPDLNLNDTDKQFMIPNTMVERTKKLYEIYRKGLLLRNEPDPGPMTVMTKDDYLNTGKKTAEQIINEADPEKRAADEKYEKTAKEVEGLKKIAGSYDLTNSERFERMSNDSSYEEFSIDRNSLVDCVETGNFPGDPKSAEMIRNLDEKYQNEFHCRIPGTYGEKACILSAKAENVFIDTNSDQGHIRYIVFLKKNERPQVLSGNTSEYAKYSNLVELKKAFDVKEENQAAKTVVEAVPKITPGFKK